MLTPLVGVMLLLLLAVVAWLQYRWVGQVSEAERDRMQAALRARATQFSEDFNREITRAYVWFQVDPTPGAADPEGSLPVAWRRWKSSAPRPALVRGVYAVLHQAGAGPILRRVNPETFALASVEWPAEFEGIQRGIQESELINSVESRLTIIRHGVPTVHADLPALVVPVPQMHFFAGRGEPRLPDADRSVAYTIVLLDRDYLSREFLPSLAARYFGADQGHDYRVVVAERQDRSRVIYRSDPGASAQESGTPDASADLLAIRLEDIATFRLTAVQPAPGGVRPPESSRFAVSIFQQRTKEGEMPVRANLAPWTVALTHRAGSLEAAVARVRRRNLLVSSGVLALLATSMVLMTVAAQRAQRLARQQVEFVAGVSHELRTPLAVIRSAGENLADGVVDDPAQIRRYGELVKGEGERLTRMVEQVLAFAGAQSAPRAAGVVDIASVVEDVLHASGPLFDAAGVRVDVGIEPRLPAVTGDAGALRRAVDNLVSNALKYGGEGRWIGVRARAEPARDPREVQVIVADRGLGIDPVDQTRVFQPFFRAASATAAQIHGTGLGLSLVKSIVENHGGRVTLESAPGRGSTFTLHLPVAVEGRAPLPAPDPEPAPYPSPRSAS
jgi:signal transduction histidine kinase